MAVPHADDPPGASAWCPHERDQTGIEPSNGDKSRLSVVKAIVDPGQMQAGEDLLGATHVQAPLLQGALPFRGIAGNAHVLM
jgi:hypothetical protein